MKPVILALILETVALKLFLVDGATGQRESQSSQLNLESTSLLAPILNNVEQLKPATISTDVLHGNLLSMEEMKIKLAIGEAQTKCKEEKLKIRDDNLETIHNLESRLAIADCQNQIKELTYTKDKEMTASLNTLKIKLIMAENELKTKDDQLQLKVVEIKDKNEKLKGNDDLIRSMDAQILELSDKVNSLFNSNLESQLAKAEGQIKSKNDTVNAQNKEINEKSEQIKNKTDIIKVKEKEISDKSEEIKNIQEEINVKDNQLKDLSAQISTKDNQIDGLNNQTKSDLGKISEMTEELFLCRGTESCPSGRQNGIFRINKPEIGLFEAPCNSTGWMTIQRRQNGSVDFSKNWEAYKYGFGNTRGEFFIGLEKLHQMTKNKPLELSIKLVNTTGHTAYAHYDNFQILSENESYKLKTLGTYNGSTNLKDGFREHEGMKFSTIDRDNDNWSGYSCANNYYGGWWYNNCGSGGLNGKYSGGSFNWESLGPLSFSEMMIKPKSV